MEVSQSRFGAPCKILAHRMRMIMRTVVDQHKTTPEEVVNDLKAVGTTVTKNTIENTVPKSVPAYKGTCTSQ